MSRSLVHIHGGDWNACTMSRTDHLYCMYSSEKHCFTKHDIPW
uniref:Uncharacterized protein n=1 Tax=Anguilla anguilla TaxID=7936 RepID=A0A0E9QXY2_ANGAN